MLLYIYRKKFDEIAARFYVASMVEAFSYLHGCGIVYRDLKVRILEMSWIFYIELYAQKLCHFSQKIYSLTTTALLNW